MLKPEEDIQVHGGGRESAIDIGGPQSPPPYDIDEDPPTHLTTDTNGHGATTTTTTTTTATPARKKLQFNMSNRIQFIPSNRQGQLNTAFLQTIPGVLKMVEIVVSFITWILAICSDRDATTSAWTEHISFEATIVVSALLLLYVVFPHLSIKDEATREGLIVVELLFYGINALLFFVAIWLMVQLSASYISDSRGAAIITAILCVIMTVLFTIETIHKFKAWKMETGSSNQVVSSTGTTAGRRYNTNAELSRDAGSELA